MRDEKVLRFGRRLRELREARGFTRKQLAESVGLSERAIVQWELGEREPGWFNVVALAGALGAEISSFVEESHVDAAPKRGRPKKVKPDTVADTVDKPRSTMKRKRREG